MADLPSKARVVIIGGGVVGCSALYHLAKKGWTDCVLLEKNELTSGSTWHAAGNVPTFSASWAIMNMQRYSTELYSRLGEEVDYPMNYHVTGSLRLAHSKERMQEFERAKGMGLYQGLDIEILDCDEIKKRYPFIETHDLAGALYDPNDGDIDPAQLTQALAKGARDKGAKIIRFCPVTSVRRDNDEWVLETEKGEIRADYVVNAAGYRAQELGEMFGRKVPMMTMSHQYLLSDQIPEIEQWSQENGRKLPLLRDVDTSYYLRQEKHGFNLGPYERNCKAHWHTEEDPMPEDFSFQLYPDDWERIEFQLEDAMARVPVLATSGINKGVNGPIPYAPDGNPLVGPMPGVPNAFECCVFTFGIAQGGGAGKVLAEWIVDGVTEWDMWAVDPRRFGDWCDHEYCVAKGMEIYGHEYAMHFPHHEWPAGRLKRLSPLHQKLAQMGAQFGAYNGYERANWYASANDDIGEESTKTWSRNGPWFQRVREECLAVRDAAGILDLPGFSRYEISGEGVVQWLESLITGSVPSIGRIGLGYFADHRGRVVTEMSVIRLADQKILLITAATAHLHDKEWLEKHLPKDNSLNLEDVTELWSCQILTGPKSRDILAEVCDADLQLPWLSIQKASIVGCDVSLFRVSFAGELGWEVHTKVGDTASVYDALLTAGRPQGLKPFGMYALDSLRLEKGYRAWKGDLSTDYTILQSGLGRFVRWSKEDFIGKVAMQAERSKAEEKQFVTLIVDARDCDAPYMSTLWYEGSIVGETTSGNWGHRIDKSIALAMLRRDLAVTGTEIEVEIYGERCRAIVQEDKPLWDPENTRLRG